MLFADFDSTENLCRSCNKRPRERGTTRCQRCNFLMKELNRKRRKRNRELGLCGLCNALVEPGKSHCRPCLDRMKARRQKRYEKNREHGTCITCGKRPVRPGRADCAVCHTRFTAYYSKKRDHIQKEVRRRYADLRKSVLDTYGRQCVCCGETREEFLAIDHVNGDGADHRKRGRASGVKILRDIIREGFPAKYRVLCHNCNCALGFYGYCPHQREREAKDGEKETRFQS